jgi:peptidyl-prolyl cis-trans isomerase SDCCAG10
MDGYYDGTIFHRIVGNFIAQGGDPTGTGEGGESATGAVFAVSFNFDLFSSYSFYT